MIYTLVNTIDTDVFQKLYNDSIDNFNSGSYPWHLYPHMNEEEKFNHIYQKATEVLSSPGGLSFLVTNESEPLMLGFGIKEGDYIKFILGFIGKDSTGSKKWLYNPQLREAREDFWRSQNVLGWVLVPNATNSAISKHVESRINNYSGENYRIEETNVNKLHDKIVVTKLL